MAIYNRIVVDAMGGDFAPKNEVEGTLLALQESIEKSTPLSIIYVGVRDKIQAVLDAYDISNKTKLLKYVEIVDASEIITMHDDPIVALKAKKDSSMVKGLQMLKENKADAYISAGNTGATLTLATIILGRIEGISRPAIGGFIPTSKRKPVLLLDIGTTIECKSRFLYEYAVLGSVLCNVIYGIENPSIGLLNVGEEDSKGTAEHIEAYNKLKSSELNFFGNVEGGDILIGKTDIVVVDGYAGNVILKLLESLGIFFQQLVDNYIDINSKNAVVVPFKEVGIQIAREALTDGFNLGLQGGVPLLGVKGNVLIGHGNASVRAMKNMIINACSVIEKELCNKIELGLKK